MPPADADRSPIGERARYSSRQIDKIVLGIFTRQTTGPSVSRVLGHVIDGTDECRATEIGSLRSAKNLDTLQILHIGQSGVEDRRAVHERDSAGTDADIAADRTNATKRQLAERPVVTPRAGGS